jgi:hypothetical protein
MSDLDLVSFGNDRLENLFVLGYELGYDGRVLSLSVFERFDVFSVDLVERCRMIVRKRR